MEAELDSRVLFNCCTPAAEFGGSISLSPDGYASPKVVETTRVSTISIACASDLLSTSSAVEAELDSRVLFNCCTPAAEFGGSISLSPDGYASPKVVETTRVSTISIACASVSVSTNAEVEAQLVSGVLCTCCARSAEFEFPIGLSTSSEPDEKTDPVAAVPELVMGTAFGTRSSPLSKSTTSALEAG